MFKHSLIRRCLAVGLLVGAASSPPAASAMSMYYSGPLRAPASTVASPKPAGPPVRAAHHRGFDWGDAGIGAAGGLGISMLAVGGVAVLGQRRERRPRRSAAATS